MKHERLEKLSAAARLSVVALREELKSAFPEGSRWKVRLRDSQVNPTVMTAMYPSWNASPMMEFSMPRKGCTVGRVLRRVVPLRRIVGPADE
jgi:hypothetical protein